MKVDAPARIAMQITDEHGGYARVRDDMHALEVRVLQGRATGPHDLDGVRRLLHQRETTT